MIVTASRTSSRACFQPPWSLARDPSFRSSRSHASIAKIARSGLDAIVTACPDTHRSTAPCPGPGVSRNAYAVPLVPIANGAAQNMPSVSKLRCALFGNASFAIPVASECASNGSSTSPRNMSARSITFAAR